jgi:hypothetical protein
MKPALKLLELSLNYYHRKSLSESLSLYHGNGHATLHKDDQVCKGFCTYGCVRETKSYLQGALNVSKVPPASLA